MLVLPSQQLEVVFQLFDLMLSPRTEVTEHLADPPSHAPVKVARKLPPERASRGRLSDFGERLDHLDAEIRIRVGEQLFQMLARGARRGELGDGGDGGTASAVRLTVTRGFDEQRGCSLVTQLRQPTDGGRANDVRPGRSVERFGEHLEGLFLARRTKGAAGSCDDEVARVPSYERRKRDHRLGRAEFAEGVGHSATHFRVAGVERGVQCGKRGGRPQRPKRRRRRSAHAPKLPCFYERFAECTHRGCVIASSELFGREQATSRSRSFRELLAKHVRRRLASDAPDDAQTWIDDDKTGPRGDRKDEGVVGLINPPNLATGLALPRLRDVELEVEFERPLLCRAQALEGLPDRDDKRARLVLHLDGEPWVAGTMHGLIKNLFEARAAHRLECPLQIARLDLARAVLRKVAMNSGPEHRVPELEPQRVDGQPALLVEVAIENVDRSIVIEADDRPPVSRVGLGEIREQIAAQAMFVLVAPVRVFMPNMLEVGREALVQPSVRPVATGNQIS